MGLIVVVFGVDHKPHVLKLCQQSWEVLQGWFWRCGIRRCLRHHGYCVTDSHAAHTGLDEARDVALNGFRGVRKEDEDDTHIVLLLVDAR